MQTKKITEVSPGAIRDAIAVVLNENDYNQMALDARYKFRDLDPVKLENLAKTDYVIQKNAALDEIEFLNEQRMMNLGNPDKINQIEDRIADLQKQLGDPYEGIEGELDKELRTNLDEVRNDPDTVKARIYRDAFFKQFGNAFKWREESIKYGDSPFEKVKQWKADNAFKWADFNERKRQFGLEYDIKVKTLEEKIKENELKHIELYGDQGLTDWTTLGNDTDGSTAAKTYSDLIEGNAAKQESIKQKIINSGYTDAQANKFIADYNKDPNSYTGPDKFIGLLKENAKIGNVNKALQEKSDQIMADAAAKVMKGKEYADVRAVMGKTIRIPQTQVVNGQVRTTYTEINGSKLIQDIQAGKVIFRSDKAPAGQIYIDYKDPEGNVKTYSFSKLFANKMAGGKELMTVAKYFNQYGADVQKEYGNQIAPLIQEYIPRIKGVPGKKEGGLAPAVALNLSALITSADYQDIAADANTNLTTASSYLDAENAKDTKVFVHNYGGDNYEIWLKNEKNPKVIQKLKVTREKIDRIFGPGYTTSYSSDAMRLKIGRGNTNINADPTQSLLQTKFGDMPNVERMDVTADLDEDASNPGVFVPMINVRKKNGRYATFPISGKNKMQRLGYEQGITQILSLIHI
jgi:hypothetical protein